MPSAIGRDVAIGGYVFGQNPSGGGFERHLLDCGDGARFAYGISSLQLGVFRLGLLEDGDIGVGVFPEV